MRHAYFCAGAVRLTKVRGKKGLKLKVADTKELGEALKSQVETIEIEGDLAKKVFRIKVTGKVAWPIAIAAVSLAVGCGVATLMSGPAAPATTSGAIVGGTLAAGGFGTATMTAIAIASVGGAAALRNLRRYKIVKHADDQLVLER